MALFNKKIASPIPFDKERIKEEILKEAPEKAPLWVIFPCDHLKKLDLLCIRSISINKEVSITSNPFSSYRRVEPSIYQIVIGVCITQEEIHEAIVDWVILAIDSADMLFRKLEEQN